MIDDKNQPISKAVVSVEGSTHAVKGSATGAYWRLLTSGDHTVTVSAPGYLPATKLVYRGYEYSIPIMFRLTRDETVMGLPRMVFIMLAGECLFRSKHPYLVLIITALWLCLLSSEVEQYGHIRCVVYSSNVVILAVNESQNRGCQVLLNRRIYNSVTTVN